MVCSNRLWGLPFKTHNTTLPSSRQTKKQWYKLIEFGVIHVELQEHPSLLTYRGSDFKPIHSLPQ